jgi:protein TonB
LRKEADKYAAKGEPIPYILLSEKPTFQGGDANTFAKWVQAHLIYHNEAKEKNIQGRVTSQFTIEEDGSISDIRIPRSSNEILSKETIKVINEANSVKWTPGKMDGKIVKVTYTFPVLFELH